MANEYLRRTPTSTGNRRVFTFSCWIKQNQNGNQYVLGAFPLGNNSSNQFDVTLSNSNNTVEIFQNTSGVTEVNAGGIAKHRDNSSWINLIVSVNTTLDNSIDRVKIYTNGILDQLTSSATLPSKNFQFNLNNVVETWIGNWPGLSTDVNSQLTDLFLVDGQALTPDVFGFYKAGKGYISAGSTQATDFRPGQWVPKTPRIIKTEIIRRGGFGVNGFYLPMNDSNNFGADFHCTPNSIIKLQENLPQPKCRIDGVGDYTGALRDDPFKQYLVLALPFVSGGLQNGFGDYSAAIKGSGSPKTGTVNGGVSIASTASYYGSGAYFDGNGDYLRTSTNISDFQFGSGDFTIETWLWKSANGGNNYDGIASLGTNGSANDGWFLEVSATRGYIFAVGGSGIVNYNVSPNTSQWIHLSVCKQGNTTTMYLNGVAVSSFTGTYTVPSTATTLDIGTYAVNYWFNGYLQDLRIYKGVAKYTGGFDVPRPYTPVGIATWRAVADTTANNFATLNPLVPSVFSSGDRSINNGNLTVTTISTGNGTNGRSTIGMSSGKWYAETYVDGIYGFLAVKGIGREDNQLFGTGGDAIHYWAQNGNKYDYTNGSQTISSYGSTYTTGDIIGISINADNGEVIFYKNGISQGVAKTFSSSLYPLFIQMEDGASSNTVTFHMNFGQNPSFSGNTTAGTFTDTNGKGLFKYQPPSGFLALCEDNLPTPVISDPGKYFKTVLWTGDGNSGRSIVGVGFTPDLVWIKERTSASSHALFDSVRGAGKRLISNSTGAEEVGSESLYNPAFNYDGFSLGSDGAINELSQTYVAWCWRAGAGTTSTNTNGSITSVVSVNQDAGFSIVSWTASGATSTIGHGLGKVPKFIIAKSRTSSGYGWTNYHTSLGKDAYIMLHSTDASASSSNYWGTSSPSTTVFGVAPFAYNNNSGNMIAYCWAEIEGFSKFGSYVGNANADGPFVYCGFKPAFVLVKLSSSSGGYWVLWDSSRTPTNLVTNAMVPNESWVETSGFDIDLLSNGFKLRDIETSLNASGATYIFAAFAESPFSYSNSK